MTPKEGSVEWWEAVARSHRRVIASPPRFKNPSFTLDDHRKAAEEAEMKAKELQVLVDYPVSKEVQESIDKALEKGKGFGVRPIHVEQSMEDFEPKVVVTAQDWEAVFGG